MFTLSAFADEISPDPLLQIRTLQACGVWHIEFRSIHKTNVLTLSMAQLHEFHSLLNHYGFKLSAIGSPIGKAPIDAPFSEQLEKLKHAIDIAQQFGTPNIRIFSFYPPTNTSWTGDWQPYRDEVISRMSRLAELAASANINLFHENEHRIFGDRVDRVLDVLTTVNKPNLRAAYDAANYVFCGYDPIDAWNRTQHLTSHLHIKDWKGTGEESHHGVIAGTGDGQIPVSIRSAVEKNYHGFAVLEPHLRGGGPTGGVTGPDLFPYAVSAFQQIVTAAGGSYN